MDYLTKYLVQFLDLFPYKSPLEPHEIILTYDFITNKIGFKPIILLDDIFDKLDDLRVKQLMSFAKDGFFGQVFITDTHENRCKEILNSTEIDFNLININ